MEIDVIPTSYGDVVTLPVEDLLEEIGLCRIVKQISVQNILEEVLDQNLLNEVLDFIEEKINPSDLIYILTGKGYVVERSPDDN